MKKSNSASFEPTTVEHIERYYGKKDALPTCIARTMFVGDRIIGIGGAMRVDDKWVIFLDADDEAYQKYPVSLIKALKDGLAYLDSIGVRKIYNVVELDTPSAHRFATNLGFLPEKGNIYVRTR